VKSINFEDKPKYDHMRNLLCEILEFTPFSFEEYDWILAKGKRKNSKCDSKLGLLNSQIKAILQKNEDKLNYPNYEEFIETECNIPEERENQEILPNFNIIVQKSRFRHSSYSSCDSNITTKTQKISPLIHQIEIKELKKICKRKRTKTVGLYEVLDLKKLN